MASYCVLRTKDNEVAVLLANGGFRFSGKVFVLLNHKSKALVTRTFNVACDLCKNKIVANRVIKKDKECPSSNYADLKFVNGRDAWEAPIGQVMKPN